MTSEIDMEQTLAIIKPDAVRQKKVGAIISEIEANGFGIAQVKRVDWKWNDAADFYEVHKQRPFFLELVQFMCSGPIFVLLLEKADAVDGWRELMGKTDPLSAAPGSSAGVSGRRFPKTRCMVPIRTKPPPERFVSFLEREDEEFPDSVEDHR